MQTRRQLTACRFRSRWFCCNPDRSCLRDQIARVREVLEDLIDNSVIGFPSRDDAGPDSEAVEKSVGPRKVMGSSALAKMFKSWVDMKLGGGIKTSALATKTVSLEGGSKDDMDPLSLDMTSRRCSAAAARGLREDEKYFRLCKIKDR